MHLLKNKNIMKDFYNLSKENYNLDCDYVCDGVYKDSPIVIIYPYTVEEVGHPKYNQLRIDIKNFDDKFWIDYLHKTMVVEQNLEATQYALFQILKRDNEKHWNKERLIT